MKPFWISWWQHPTVAHELHSPWWYTGERGVGDDDAQSSICAAVMAEDEDDAKRRVIAAHDEPVELEWRFVEERAPDWSPFNSRFLQSDWMVWP